MLRPADSISIDVMILTMARFVDCEKWREEIKLDDTVPTWEYPEKEEMFKYYPQYYHKTDKVRPACFFLPGGGPR